MRPRPAPLTARAADECTPGKGWGFSRVDAQRRQVDALEPLVDLAADPGREEVDRPVDAVGEQGATRSSASTTLATAGYRSGG
jgi:hypothetical protein